MRLVIAGGGTGGHLIPALVLAETLRELRPAIEPVLVGAARGLEAQVLPRYPFRYHLIPAEPIYRRAWWRNLRWPLIAWRVWEEVGRVLRLEAPAVVIGTGGYAAGPLLWRAQCLGLPTVLQEQNAFPGLTTRWLARRARQVHLGFPEARTRLRVGKDTQVCTHGNPIRPPPPEPRDRSQALEAFGLVPGRPTVLVFGGSQGARAINEALAGALARDLLVGVNILWGTGSAHHTALRGFARDGRVAVRGFFDPMTPAYGAADLVVCRAGAMTVAEICAWGKPSVLIPFPGAAADHQTFNARALAAAGAAVLLPQSELSPVSLAHLLLELLADRARLASLADVARGRGNPNASRQLVSKILTLVS